MKTHSQPRSSSDWLTYLEKRHSTEIQLGLERITEVARQMDLLKPTVPVITVAGTNGKGTCVAALEALFKTAGYSVGAFTSPHLIQFNERIKINQELISDECLCHIFKLIEESRADIILTFFEVATLAALYYFKQQQVDIIVLEVGLGGRLDATNIIDADIAIITSIDLDHQHFLGDTREAIAIEKAGILRPYQTCILAGENLPKSLIDYTKKLNCRSYHLNRDYSFTVDDDFLHINCFDKSHAIPYYHRHLNPISLSAAIVASILIEETFPNLIMNRGVALNNIQLQGRLDLRDPFKNCSAQLLFDVAHNRESAKNLACYLKNLIKKNLYKGKIYAIFSALKDKNIHELISPLLPFVDEWLLSRLEGPRALDASRLDLILNKYDIMGASYESPVMAFQNVIPIAKSGDLILVYGSFYTVGAILKYIKVTQEAL